jgi:peroxiredoxin
MRRRAIGYAIAGSVLLAVSFVSAYLARTRSTAVGAKANLELTLKDANGADVRLSDYRGRPIVINFWATWCPPCLLETPELVDLHEQYKDRGLVIVGISYDDEPEQVKAFAKQFRVEYPLLLGRDREDVFRAFGLGDALPTSIFIRPDGTIAARLEGINTKEWFQEQIEGMLSE